MREILLSIVVIISVNYFSSCTNNENYKRWVYEDDIEQITVIFYGNNKGEWQIRDKWPTSINNSMFPINYTDNEIIINNLFEKYEYFIDGKEIIVKLSMTGDFNDNLPYTRKSREYIFEKIEENSNVPITGKWEIVDYNYGIIVMELFSDNSGKEYFNNNEPFALSYTISKEIHFSMIFDGTITVKYEFGEMKSYYKIQDQYMLVFQYFPNYNIYKKVDN
jgi:hypothetical protein